ncbi:MAG: tetratricopeptide repeat protein, partial [Alphaproteobacteria bacterium]|nr:tetratricopeptide repeat protein [Alphaproteobacteria bacterium]
RAVDADPDYWFSPYVLADAHFYRHEVDAFFTWAEQAMAMNPGNATALANLGGKMMWAGRVDEGMPLVLKATTLNPRYPSWYNYFLSTGHYMRGEYEEALAAALKMDWGIAWDYVNRAVAYAQLGRTAEARGEIKSLLEADPDFGREVWQRFRVFNFPDERIRQFIEGLRKAGLEVSDEPPLTD